MAVAARHCRVGRRRDLWVGLAVRAATAENRLPVICPDPPVWPDWTVCSTFVVAKVPMACMFVIRFAVWRKLDAMR